VIGRAPKIVHLGGDPPLYRHEWDGRGLMNDTVETYERETVYIRKFADAAARDRDEALEVVQITQESVGGVADTPTMLTVDRSNANFGIIDAAARDAEARAKKGG
jgi:hypothetical protein